VGIYCPALPPGRGGVSDHSLALARCLAELGAGGALMGRDGSPAAPAGWRVIDGVQPNGGRRSLAAAASEAGLGAVVIQYVPFMYSRSGLSPALVRAAGNLEELGVKVAVFLHEPYVPFTRLAWMVTGIPMRLQFRALMRRAGVIVSPVPRFLALARAAARKGTPCAVAPVGATVTVSRLPRHEARERLALAADELCIGVFSPAASGFLADRVRAAAERLVSEGKPATWLCMGNGSASLAARLGGARCRDLGTLDEPGVAIRALDLAAQPFVDGLTLRRTSAMAALAHGIPLVSSTGPLFDPALAAAARCEPSAASFAAAVTELAADPAARAALGERGRRFYETDGSTMVGARRLLGLVTGATG
jgi:glycosyltransferase involved in cell wall biosynthesis